jgi:hypothetical protein
VSVAIPFEQMYAHNFGHALGDNLFSFWRILQLFNIYSDSLDFLPIQLAKLRPKLSLGGLNVTLHPFIYNRGLSYMSEMMEKDVIQYTSFPYFYNKQLLLLN